MLKARHKDLHPLLKAAEWLLIMVVCTAAVFALWQVLPVNHGSTGALLLFQALQAIGLGYRTVHRSAVCSSIPVERSTAGVAAYSR